jgi:hypothetical protein
MISKNSIMPCSNHPGSASAGQEYIQKEDGQATAGVEWEGAAACLPSDRQWDAAVTVQAVADRKPQFLQSLQPQKIRQAMALFMINLVVKLLMQREQTDEGYFHQATP